MKQFIRFKSYSANQTKTALAADQLIQNSNESLPSPHQLRSETSGFINTDNAELRDSDSVAVLIGCSFAESSKCADTVGFTSGLEQLICEEGLHYKSLNTSDSGMTALDHVHVATARLSVTISRDSHIIHCVGQPDKNVRESPENIGARFQC